MYLSDLNKDIVNSIHNSKIRCGFSFIINIHPHLIKSFKKVYSGDKYILQESDNHIDSYIYTVNDLPEIDKAFTNFISLLEILIEEKLVIAIKDPHFVKPQKFLISEEHLKSRNYVPGNHYNPIASLVESYYHNGHNTDLFTFDNLKIVETPLLKDFIDDNFRTKKEKHNDDSLKGAKKSSTIALLTAIASIILSIIFTLFTSISSSEQFESFENTLMQDLTIIESKLYQINNKQQHIDLEELERTLTNLYQETTQFSKLNNSTKNIEKTLLKVNDNIYNIQKEIKKNE